VVFPTLLIHCSLFLPLAVVWVPPCPLIKGVNLATFPKPFPPPVLLLPHDLNLARPRFLLHTSFFEFPLGCTLSLYPFFCWLVLRDTSEPPPRGGILSSRTFLFILQSRVPFLFSEVAFFCVSPFYEGKLFSFSTPSTTQMPTPPCPHWDFRSP